MEMLRMPLAEARESFTLSEMVMISWRSQEQYWQMKKKLGDGPRGGKDTGGDESHEGGRAEYADPLVASLPDRFFNKDGELDLSQVTGPEAVRYLNAASSRAGLPLFPMIGGMGKG